MEKDEIERAVQARGLEKFYQLEPEVVQAAYESARGLSGRIRRLEDMTSEPAHVYGFAAIGPQKK